MFVGSPGLRKLIETSQKQLTDLNKRVRCRLPCARSHAFDEQITDGGKNAEEFLKRYKASYLLQFTRLNLAV